MRTQRGTHGAGILVVCTANLCRSPMAAALLSRRLTALDVTVPVGSGGMLTDDDPALPEVVAVMAGYGLDVERHRSRVARAADLAAAGLVLGMAREHVRYAIVTAPEAWPRAFTLKELVRLGEQIGPRSAAEPFAGWLSRAHAGRKRSALLGDSADDDVADPVGGPPRRYAETAAILDRLVGRLAELCWGHAGRAS
jgi:protein-tyrosine phosphatase